MKSGHGLGTATVIRSDARRLPLPDGSVDLVVTSPPYFALRSYQDGGVHYDGQIGSEPTPSDFIDALLEVTRECVRVLKPSGSLWVNLGDKYVAGTSAKRPSTSPAREHGGYASGQALHSSDRRLSEADAGGIRTKSLMGLPWRFALRCIDELGLILRAEVIWSKPNGLPESVTDRVRRSHEQWFHFTLQPRYFSAVDEIREPHAEVSIKRAMPHRSPAGRRDADVYQDATGQTLALDQANHPLGKLPGSVWTIPTEPLRVPDHLGIDHFAAFPTEWPKRIIQGWSPSGICVECGEGRRPSAEVPSTGGAVARAHRHIPGYEDPAGIGRRDVRYAITGYSCACPEPAAPTRSAVVLDPFGGTGTTAMVAKALGRHGITVDMSADYCRLAEWRTNDRDQLAKVLDIPKAEQQPAGQGDLLELLTQEGAPS